MKYSTFVLLRAVLIVGLILVPIFAWIGCRPKSAPTTAPPPVAQVSAFPDRNAAPAPPVAQNNAPTAPAPGPGTDTAAFTDVHRAILRLQKEPLTNGKEKNGTIQWVYKDAGIRAEFRSDKNKGFNYWNRVKIDYNGNKSDDERWDFNKDGTVKRRVSPNDDGNYTETYTLQGEQWIRR